MDEPWLGQVREKYRVPLERGEAIAERVRADLDPLSEALILVGSIRRRRHVVADVEFVALPKDPAEFHRALEAAGFEAGGKRRKYTGVLDGIKVEIYAARKPEELGALVLAYTGDALLNVAMRSKAKRMGYKMDQYGIWKGRRAVLQSPDERDFFDFLGMDWHWPEERSLAARTETEKMIRALRRDEDLPADDRAFVERTASDLKTRRYLPPAEEVSLKALYERRTGAKAPVSMGAEELIELGQEWPFGDVAENGVANGFPVDAEPSPEEEDEENELRRAWQMVYDASVGGRGRVVGVAVRPSYGLRDIRIWVATDEPEGRAHWIVYDGPIGEEEARLLDEEPERYLAEIARVMTEDPLPWEGPFEAPWEG